MQLGGISISPEGDLVPTGTQLLFHSWVVTMKDCKQVFEQMLEQRHPQQVCSEQPQSGNNPSAPRWMEGWINRMRPLHTGEYDSATKTNTALAPAAPWMDLE